MTVEDRREVHHPFFARLYERIAAQGEARGAGEHREALLEGLGGRVVEVGAGNGATFAHYPRSVEQVVAIEPEDYLRRRALEAGADARVEVEVVDAVADALPGDDESFDAGVVSLVLCSVPQQDRALAELHRVIRPGGELRFYEHVVARRPAVARLQRLADATLWPKVAGGCHMARDTTSAIEEAGFEVEAMERFPFSPSPVMPGVTHVLGRARRP